jgi:hypothetical protein
MKYSVEVHDMFHDMLVPICFTICLFISPDLDGNRGTTKKKMCPDGMFPERPDMFPICFTICLFISPDLDGSRALKTSLRH